MGQDADRQQTLLRPPGDPLWRLLIERLKIPWPIIPVVVPVVGAALLYGLGAVVSYRCHPEANIIRVFDPEHLYYSLIVCFIGTPLIWLIYLWQPVGLANTLDSLRDNEVIVETQDQTLETFAAMMTKALDSRRLLIAVVVALLALLVLESLLIFPMETVRRGRAFFWYYDTVYYLLIWVPLVYVTVYALVILIAKSILALVWLNLLFRRFPARVHPLFPDGVGGFAPLGHLAVKYGLVAVFLGLAVASFDIARYLFGPGGVYVDSLLFWACYATLTPTCLIAPIWSAHKGMVAHKNRLLRDVSRGIEGALAQATPNRSESLEESAKILSELKSRYTLINDSYPTWPVSFGTFRRFSITAALPLITGVASILIDVVAKMAADGL
jgi:hypothetical protein